MTCPMHPERTDPRWCLDCERAKEGLCDYPHKVTVLKKKDVLDEQRRT